MNKLTENIEAVIDIKSTEDKEEDKYVAILPRYKNNEQSVIAEDLVHLYFSTEKFKKNKLDSYTQSKLNDLKNHIETEFCIQTKKNYKTKIIKENDITAIQMRFINMKNSNKSLILRFRKEGINCINLTNVEIEEIISDNYNKKITKYTVEKTKLVNNTTKHLDKNMTKMFKLRCNSLPC